MRLLCFLFLVVFAGAAGLLAYENQRDVQLTLLNRSVTVGTPARSSSPRRHTRTRPCSRTSITSSSACWRFNAHTRSCRWATRSAEAATRRASARNESRRRAKAL